MSNLPNLSPKQNNNSESTKTIIFVGMVKIRVHIESEDVYMDKRAFKEIMLPAIPRVGDFIYLDKSDLQLILKSDKEIANDYRRWFYGAEGMRVSDPEYELQEKDLEGISLEDACHVCSVCFYENEDYVGIEITA